MLALVMSVIFSEVMVSGVLVWLFEYPLLKAFLTSSAVIALYLSFACFSRVMSIYMARSMGMYRDPEREKTVRRIMDKYGLTKCAPEDLDIRIIKDDTLNAYALWRNIVGVNTGLLDGVPEAEIAAVIGHELGHLRYMDSIYSTCTFSMLVPAGHALVFLAMLASIPICILVSLVAGDASERAAAAVSSAVVTVAVMLFRLMRIFAMARSRSCEHRADLFSASLSPELREGMLSFLNRIDVHGEPGLYARLYGTHPSPKKRMQKIKEVLADAC